MKWSFEIPPDPIPDNQIAETIEAEVIVVGAGTAGLITANSALDKGLDVRLISASSMPIYRGGSNHAVMSKAKKRLGLEAGDSVLFEREIINNEVTADQRKCTHSITKAKKRWIGLSISWNQKAMKSDLSKDWNSPRRGTFFALDGAQGFMTAEKHTMGFNHNFVVDELAARLAKTWPCAAMGGAVLVVMSTKSLGYHTTAPKSACDIGGYRITLT